MQHQVVRVLKGMHPTWKENPKLASLQTPVLYLSTQACASVLNLTGSNACETKCKSERAADGLASIAKQCVTTVVSRRCCQQ
jgi:hypothetical protein